MKIAIVIGGFEATRAHVQPWRYVGELAAGLALRGHVVTVHTDVPQERVVELPGVKVVSSWSVPKFGSRGRRPALGEGEGVILWNTGRLAPLYPLRQRPGDRNIAILTAPLYSPMEVARILRASGRYISIAAIHVAGALIPTRVLARHLSTHYEATVTLADYAADRLVAAGLPRHQVRSIAPATDETPSYMVIPSGSGTGRPAVFTFAGNASRARGADVLVRAFAAAFRHAPNVRLRLAIRHEDASLREAESRLADEIRAVSLGDRVEVFGNLGHDEILALFRDSTAAVLPFRVVPSEAPIMPLEISSVGGTLITSDLPPLRAVAGPGTIFVRPGSVSDLRRALLLAVDRAGADSRGTPGTGDRRAQASRRTWADVVEEVESLVDNNGATARSTVHTPYPRVVYLCGNDGTGKTTQAQLLVEALNARGIPARYLWLRYPQLVSLPVLLLSRLLGVTRYDTIAGHRTGQWQFYRAKWLARILLWTQVIDAWLFRLVRIDLPASRGTMIVLDRFALDIIVDIAAAARDASLVLSVPARMLARLVPEGVTIVLDADAGVIRARRGDLAADPVLEARPGLYRRAARLVPAATVIDGLQEVEAVHFQIMRQCLGDLA